MTTSKGSPLAIRRSAPEYDQSFLIAPPGDDETPADGEAASEEQAMALA
jgi:hypothetical protein